LKESHERRIEFGDYGVGDLGRRRGPKILVGIWQDKGLKKRLGNIVGLLKFSVEA